MGRLFCEHSVRQVQSLDGAWRFAVDREDRGREEGWSSCLPESVFASVPSVWNTAEGLLTYEGVAWYSKEFYTLGGTLRFCFGAVMTEADVWLDGEHLGYHYGGFSQFDFIVPDVEAGAHTLTVRVDNRFGDTSIPQKWVDWYHYGGITRSVTVETLVGLSVMGNRMEYTLSQDMKSAKCSVIADIYNVSKRAKSTAVEVYFDNKKVSECNIEVRGRRRLTVELPEFEIKDIRLWDIGKGNLYSIRIATDSDDLFDRVGFRKVEIKDKKFLLNGRAIELRGVNRHEEHPEFGFAFPTALMKRDADLALAMGCNALRGSHYPNAQEFVDLLDEVGMLFWSEIPIWGCGFSDKALANRTVVKRGLDMHREMVKYYYNHPSIIIWGMHNEIHTYTKAAYNMTKSYYEFLKANGGNRAVTYATCNPDKDICYEFCDIISLNQYFGWYYGFEDDAWANFLKKFKEQMKEQGYGDKPIIMSEFGCAAVFGTHDDGGILWCEENQAKQIRDCLELFHADEAVVGMYIWQLFDMRTCKEAGLNRARGFNNKGLMNEHRKPKLAYWAAQKAYRSFEEEEKQ